MVSTWLCPQVDPEKALRWERAVSVISGRWLKAGTMLADKMKTLRERVKDFDRSASPKTKRSKFNMLEVALDEVIHIVLPLGHKLRQIEAGSDEHATVWV